MNHATEPEQTLLLKQPTVSAQEVVFLYAGELWIAARSGANPRRLTAQKGPKWDPFFSPDGAWVAFTANYDGSPSVYVISRQGGSPRRLTYHPDADLVRGWSPDGSQVLFSSTFKSPFQRCRRLFTVPFEGGLPAPLPMDMAERGSYSPDGKFLAYTRYFETFWTWKRYRGGMTLPIWVLDLATYDHVEIPHENASDTFPAWLGTAVYFLSDRNRMMNVFRWDSASHKVEQITFHEDFDVRALSAGPDCLSYEQGGRLHLIDPDTRQNHALSISVAPDLPELRPTYKKAAPHIQNAVLSPGGQRAAFEARGHIFTVPAKKGDIRCLTHTPGVCERYPAWSPDGQSIAYFSDAGGEYDLVVSDQKGVKKTTFPLKRQSFFYTPLWSPDSQKIAFTDKALNLYYLRLDNGEVVHVDSDTYDHPERTLHPAWSPDSQWLTYTRKLDNQIRAVFLYELAAAKCHQVTDGLSDATSACFSRDGKHLFFTASTNFGLNTGWLDMSSIERPVTRSLYVAVLNKEDPSPLAPESDEEKPVDEKKESDAGQEAKDKSPTAEKEQKKPEPVVVKIDLQGLEQRILALPVPALNYHNLQTAEGKLFYLEMPQQIIANEEVPASSCLHAFDMKERKTEVFLEKVVAYQVSADGKHLLYRSAGEPKFAIVAVEKKPTPEEGILNLGAMEVAVDPRAEWKQIYREAFRIQRDFFYDPGMHGLNWEAAYLKYLPFLEHVGHREDLNYLLEELTSELVVGHVFVDGGDIPNPEPVAIGMLGMDVEVDADGYYHIQHIYPGLNWHPELRSPLTEPGVNVKEGEIILAVNGRPLRAPDPFYLAFEKTAEHVTDLLVGPSADGSQARTVTVKPLASELALRHWHWVENNRKKVETLSGGRVGYVYLPNTSTDGYKNFNAYYFSQLDKQAFVLDERFNGGGFVADYIVDLLDRRLLSYWATREGKVFTTPNASIFGPKVMIINELAGSGGDALPNFFRRRGLGKLVGKRTWGGLVGIYDYPVLIDGGFYTAPRMAIYSPQGEWEVENVGVAPDFEVEMATKLVVAGRDPQLEKAVEVVLAELEAAPFVRVPRPPSPQRV